MLSPSLISATLIVCALWTTFGVGRRDFYIIVPNACGFTIGLVQLALFLGYRQPAASSISVKSKKERQSYDQLVENTAF